ncbi:MAG: hypothetical protein QM500_05280 [Methylococcales bacterium]
MSITDNKPLPAFVDSDDSFIVKELLWLSENQSTECLYQQIVSKVLRKPNKLMFHLQRIYFTYHSEMYEQLYAALVDLLWVLEGKGLALSHRMVNATRSILTEAQAKMLDEYLKKQNINFLLGNKFSVCTAKGINSQALIIKKIATIDERYDPLELAKDYIEYSQLESALQTLENALIDEPDRQDIQAELLDLLKKTSNTKAFKRITDTLLANGWKESTEWLDIAGYFAGISNEK